MDYTVHGILQARTLEWAALPFSRGSSQPRDRTQVSHIAGGFFTSWAKLKGWLENWEVVTIHLGKLKCIQLEPKGQAAGIFFLFSKRRKLFYLFIWLSWIFIASCGVCSTRDLVLWPGIKIPGPLYWGAWTLGHWTTKEVPWLIFL